MLFPSSLPSRLPCLTSPWACTLHNSPTIPYSLGRWFKGTRRLSLVCKRPGSGHRPSTTYYTSTSQTSLPIIILPPLTPLYSPPVSHLCAYVKFSLSLFLSLSLSFSQSLSFPSPPPTVSEPECQSLQLIIMLIVSRCGHSYTNVSSTESASCTVSSECRGYACMRYSWVWTSKDLCLPRLHRKG